MPVVGFYLPILFKFFPFFDEISHAFKSLRQRNTSVWAM